MRKNNAGHFYLQTRDEKLGADGDGKVIPNQPLKAFFKLIIELF